VTRQRRAAVAICAASLALLLCGCATRVFDASAARVVERAVVAPYATQEECVDLADGDRLDYRYDSSAPLDFNIHYVEGNTQLAPIVRERSTADIGVFEARIAERYCISWEAGPPGAIVSYRLAVRRKAP
jgi:hypothetical protein